SGDGQNDNYSIPKSETIIGVSQFQIFGRYGGLIYNSPKESGGPATSHSWDGTNNGQEAPPDVYVVKAVLQLANGVLGELELPCPQEVLCPQDSPWEPQSSL